MSTHVPWLAAAVSLAAGFSTLGVRAAQPALQYEITQAGTGHADHPVPLAPGQRPLVLALGGGGAKGIAHAGILQRLQEEGIPVAGIAGTSAGAFVGSLYAAGYSGTAVESILATFDLGSLMLDRNRRAPGTTLQEQEDDAVTWIRFLLEPGKGAASSPGASSGRNLRHALQVLLARSNLDSGGSFDRLRVPFRAVSTDLQTGLAFAPAQGDLPSAVCASMSIPGILSPVPWNGDQLVDGMLVQNLPVETARSLDPRAAILAVEVGQGLESAYRTSVLGLAFRSLDVSIENRTEISRRAADLVLKPDTRAITYLEFHRQVRAAVLEGRKAFDRNLDALEDLLYGPAAALPAPGGVPAVVGPAPLAARVQALADASLPAGPRQNRHYLRWMRRIEAEGLARRVDLQFTGEGPVLTLEPYPVIRKVEVRAPESWHGVLDSLLEGSHVKAGVPYNPVSLERSLDALVLHATLQARPWLKVERAEFDPDQGLLVVEVQEAWPRNLRVQGNLLPQHERAGLEKLVQPLEGHPVDAWTLANTLTLAEKHLALKDLHLEPDPADPSGSIMQVMPVPDRRIAIEGQLAYESTWETHGALGLHGDHVLGTGYGLGLRASADRLQNEAVLEASRTSGTWPRLGFRASAARTVYRFLPESLRTPFQPADFQALLPGHALHGSRLALESYARFGAEGRGMASLALSRAWYSLHPDVQGQPQPAVSQVQALGEWDDLDRGLFATRGTLVRARVGLGWLDRPDAWNRATRFESAYAQFTHFWPVGTWASLEGDLEAGLGWRLPFSQWYSVGGPAFLAGTPSAALRTPNFALARVGLPIPVVQEHVANLQIIPRFDLGRMAPVEPGQLTSSTQVRGLSLGVRAEIWRCYCELAGGRWSTRAPGRSEGFRVNLLVGTRPFSLWRNP